jgi:hypothetical protein
MCENDLHKLASQYNLRVQVLPSVTLVYSKLNEWVVESDYNDNLKLYHFNNPRRNCKVHQQIEFYDDTATYNYVFQYIKGHDDAVLTGTKHLKRIR